MLNAKGTHLYTCTCTWKVRSSDVVHYSAYRAMPWMQITHDYSLFLIHTPRAWDHLRQ